MTASEEEYFKQCEATLEEIAEAQKLNPDMTREQLVEGIAQMKGSVGRERCWKCSKWSGGWISDWDDGRLKQLCPECAVNHPECNVMFMYDIKKLHEEHPDVVSWNPNFSLNKGEKVDA